MTTNTEWPKVPTTGDELMVRWAQRDAEYAKDRVALDITAAAAVIAARHREVAMLPRADRARMWARAKTWTPPVNPEFGSMKDWIE